MRRRPLTEGFGAEASNLVRELPDPTPEQRRALARITKAAEAFRRAREARDEAIWQAHLAGLSKRQAAMAAGLSHTEGQRILERRAAVEGIVLPKRKRTT